MSPVPSFSILIPVFDERESLPGLLREIAVALAAWTGEYELLLVDDGSTDGGVEALPVRPEGRRVLRHARRCGKSAALLSGVRAARGALVVTLDGDGQDDPAEIPRLLQAFAADPGLELVSGVRRRRRDPAPRRWASRVANAVRAALLRDGCPDSACGLKAFRRGPFLALPAFSGMHRFLPALFRLRGGRTACIAVAHRPRRFGVSKYRNLGRGLNGLLDLLGVLWLQRRALPDCNPTQPDREP